MIYLGRSKNRKSLTDPAIPTMMSDMSTRKGLIDAFVVGTGVATGESAAIT